MQSIMKNPRKKLFLTTGCSACLNTRGAQASGFDHAEAEKRVILIKFLSSPDGYTAASVRWASGFDRVEAGRRVI